MEFYTLFFDMSRETTIIGITYDSQGFYFLSNLEEHGSIRNMEKKVPNYKVVDKGIL